MSDEQEVFKIGVRDYEYADEGGEDEYQCIFTVGVQTFLIGPRYPTKDEADWMADQLARAMKTVLEGFGLEGECEDIPRVQ